MNGKGTYVAGDGSYYTGDMKDNKFEGNGSIVWSNGASYEGDFSKGVYHGFGHYSNSNESKVFKGSIFGMKCKG